MNIIINFIGTIITDELLVKEFYRCLSNMYDDPVRRDVLFNFEKKAKVFLHI